GRVRHGGGEGRPRAAVLPDDQPAVLGPAHAATAAEPVPAATGAAARRLPTGTAARGTTTESTAESVWPRPAGTAGLGRWPLMMGNLIKAEFRKILTTKSWWALLIPAAVLAFAFAAGLGYIANEFGNILTSSEAERIASALGIETGSLPMGLLAVGRAINMALMFAVIIGVFAVAGEYSKKTITTTFLTAPNRAMALTSKMITYISWGALYGLAAVAAASLGILLGVDSERLPTASQ